MSSLEFDQRVEKIIAIRIDGAQLHDIRPFASQQDPPWDVTDRQLKRYMEAADKIIRKRIDRRRSSVIALHLTARRSLYARCMNAAQFGEALRALDSEAKLRGLFISPAELKTMKAEITELRKAMGLDSPPVPSATQSTSPAESGNGRGPGEPPA